MQGRLSLRERLVILVVAAVLPIFALSLWVALRETRSAKQMAQSQLRFAASLLAANQDRAVDAAEQLLGAIAAMPDLRALTAGRCQTYFEKLREHYPMYSNIGLVGADGFVACHARGSIGNAPVADRGYFRQALSERRFVMGEPIFGRLTGRRALPFALPVLDAGQVTGVVFATLDLEQASAALGRAQVPVGARIAVADRRGRVLMEFPPNAGRPLPRDSTQAELLTAARTMTGGVGEGLNADGERRIYAFAPSRLIGDEGFVVRVGISSADVTAAASRNLRDALVVLGLALLGTIAAAWAVGGRMIVMPAGQIVAAVRRLERGKVDTRVPLQGGFQRGEFARIGAAFNLMAESLQLRQADLQNELGRSRDAYAALDLVLNSMKEGLIAVTAEGRYLMFNEAATRLFPLDGQAPPIHAWPAHFGCFDADGITPLSVEEIPLVRSALGESGQAQIVVRNRVVPEGRRLQCSWQPIRGEGGLTGGLVVFMDVTELQRLQSEQAAQFGELRETQRRLIEAQRIGRMGNWEMDLRAGRIWWSDEVYVLFGVAPGEFDGTIAGFSRLLLPEDQALLKPARDTALRDGGVMDVEYRIVKPDGSLAWMHEIAEARRDDGGEPIWFGGVVQDITARKAHERENAALFAQVQELNAGLETRISERTAALSRQEQMYRTLSEQAPEVVWNTDEAGNVIYLNRAWYDLVGGEPRDWLGHGWSCRIHPDDAGEVQRNWEQSRQTRLAYSGTRRILAADGTYHTMSYKAAPIIDELGKVTSWVGIDADITEFKAIEHALRSSNQELEAFSYSVSHDLRAPLGAIGGFSRALALKLEGLADERASHYLARIQAGVGKMEQQIESLLSLSKVVRAPLNWAAVDLAAIARETLEGLHMQEPGRRVVTRVQDDLVAHGDARLLRLVLENLLGNAWKFTSCAGAASIEVGRLAGSPVFFVRDNGVGFDMAYAGKLFTAFQRLHADAEFPGTGIGLATVRRIVARHQGRVWAESSPERGTTFYFALSEIPPPAWLAADRPA